MVLALAALKTASEAKLPRAAVVEARGDEVLSPADDVEPSLEPASELLGQLEQLEEAVATAE
eukprot:8544978-Alexandrium_andersonii.AAC.1